jgi:hypothetical protein
MNIKSFNKNLIGPIIAISTIIFSLMYVYNEDNSNPLRESIESIKAEKMRVQQQIDTQSKIPSHKIGLLEDNYISFVKQTTMLFRNTPEVSGFSLSVPESLDGSLSGAMKPYEDSQIVHYIYCEAQINLDGATELSKTDFLTNFKPLKYFEKISSQYTIVIDYVEKTGQMYSIKFKILGKKE